MSVEEFAALRGKKSQKLTILFFSDRKSPNMGRLWSNLAGRYAVVRSCGAKNRKKSYFDTGNFLPENMLNFFPTKPDDLGYSATSSRFLGSSRITHPG